MSGVRRGVKGVPERLDGMGTTGGMGGTGLLRVLQVFLERGGVSRLHVAGAGVPLPQAQCTHFPRLMVLLEGALEFETGGKHGTRRVELGPGDALFSAGETWDRPEWGEACTLLTLLLGTRHIGLSLVRHGPQGMGVEKAGGTWPADGVLASLLESLQRHAVRDERSPAEVGLVNGMLDECRVHFRERSLSKSGKASRTFESLCLYIQANLALPLTRERVAAQFGLSPNHVSRLFRQQGHHRFVDYLNQARVEQAKVLLRETDLTIKEVAGRTGFRDHAYFHRVFRRLARITPLAFRHRPA